MLLERAYGELACDSTFVAWTDRTRRRFVCVPPLRSARELSADVGDTYGDGLFLSDFSSSWADPVFAGLSAELESTGNRMRDSLRVGRVMVALF